MKIFYMVVRGKHQRDREVKMLIYDASIRHDTLTDAISEAERLCRKEKVEFYVMKSICRCESEDTPVRWVNMTPDNNNKGFLSPEQKPLDCCGHDGCKTDYVGG